MEKTIIAELNRLQNEYFEDQEEFLHHKNKYHEYRDKCEKIKDKLRAKLKELNEINPDHEYELESEIIL
ncbi:hypothetical protein WMW72_12335 [Paenibacillus filicis]|uniref:Uncharacterized protein n=1 Tax=Paenibacillus filicis TaxID=669464 RepID=A0ABU9DIK6_9BACL